MLDADIETFKEQLPSEASARLFSGMFFAFMFVYINILSTTERQKGKERVRFTTANLYSFLAAPPSSCNRTLCEIQFGSLTIILPAVLESYGREIKKYRPY